MTMTMTMTNILFSDMSVHITYKYTLCTMLKTVMVYQEKPYKFYSHNLRSSFQYLCITLVIKNYMSLNLIHSMIF